MRCLAPMVDGSDPCFRLFLNTQVTHTWTPMYNTATLTNNTKQVPLILRSIELEKELTDH